MDPGAAPAPTATGFLSVLEEAERSDLLGRGRRRRYRRGATVFDEGGGSDAIVVVLSGRVKVSTVTPDGKEVVLAFRGPGDLLGELSAIDGGARSATVGALEPVDAAVVAATDFRAFLSAHPRVAILLLEMLARRLRDADRKRVEFGAHDTLGRVAARLVELAERYGEAVTAGMRGDDLALEGGEGVAEHRYTTARELPVQAGEPIRTGRGGSDCERLVLSPQHVDAEAPYPSHTRPRERAAGRAERHQGRLERDGGERVDDQPGGLAVRRGRHEGDAGRQPAESFAERARVGRRRGGG